MPQKPSLLERALEDVAARMDRWTTEDQRETGHVEVLRMLAQAIADERDKRDREVAAQNAAEEAILADIRGNGQD